MLSGLSPARKFAAEKVGSPKTILSNYLSVV
jgi:hypothetical protein